VSIYEGVDICSGSVRITPPDAAQVASAVDEADLSDDQTMWFARAQRDDRCMYFAIQHELELIGQIILHDIDAPQREAMVGYHIFQLAQRGHGYGTAALTALCSYAFGTLGLMRLVAITSLDNVASRRLAAKCAFRELGAAREEPHLVVYERTSLTNPP